MIEPKLPLKTKIVSMEVPDYDQYWCLDYNAEQVDGPPCYTFDKEDYPLLQNAVDALKLHWAENKEWRAKAQAETKEYRRQQRAAKKEARTK